MVEEILPTVVKEEKFDEDTFKKENKEMYEKYLVEIEKTKSGKKGYVRMTIGKEKDNE